MGAVPVVEGDGRGRQGDLVATEIGADLAQARARTVDGHPGGKPRAAIGVGAKQEALGIRGHLTGAQRPQAWRSRLHWHGPLVHGKHQSPLIRPGPLEPVLVAPALRIAIDAAPSEREIRKER